jgi:hypothetical protein
MNGSRVDRLWIVGGVVVAFILVAAAWFLAISPTMASTSTVNGQTSDAQLQTERLQHTISVLKAESAQTSSLQAALVAARAQLPDDDALSAFTRKVQAQATSAGVDLTGITVGSPTPTQVGKGAASTTGTAASPNTSPAGQLYAIPVTLSVSGADVARNIKFIDLLQHHGDRAALLSNVQLSDSDNAGGKQALSLQVTLFAAPQTPAAEQALLKLAGSGS